MMRPHRLLVRPSLLLTTAVLTASSAAARHAPAAGTADPSALWFAALEVPLLLVCLVFALLTARALRGGAFGFGMQLLAGGFLVMAAGHLHMQVKHFTGFSLFETLFGGTGGAIAWFAALVATWTLSGYGFYRMYRAARVLA